jgi:hypothetical protein
MGSIARLIGQSRFYARVVATLGTIAEREIDEIGDAVFGWAEEATSLHSLGRMVLRRVLQISDSLQSVTADARSGHVSGAQILQP